MKIIQFKKICFRQVGGGIENEKGSIQEAIDASANSDTILVEPNIYFENIDFKSKTIVIGSLYSTTKDSTLISRTIIDGSANGSVVTITNNPDPIFTTCKLATIH